MMKVIAIQPGIGVSPTRPFIFPVIPPVDVHDTMCPSASIPTAPTVPPLLKTHVNSQFGHVFALNLQLDKRNFQDLLK